MAIYAKLKNKYQLEFAPKYKDGIFNYDLDIENLINDGYKPFIEIEKPITDRKFEINYIENEENISESIIYLETEEEYQIRKNNENIQLDIDLLNSQINELDLKRIRAVCEPSIKDETNGETWLEYYNAQVLDLRYQINTLKERITPNDITNENLPPLDSGQ